MSKVTVTPASPGDIRNPNILNSSLGSVAAASADIDEENVREEGLDQSVLTSSIATQVTTGSSQFVKSTSEGTFSNTAWATLVLGAANIRTTQFTVPANARARVRVQLGLLNKEVINAYAVPVGGNGGSSVEAAIAYQPSGGGTTLKTKSIRGLGAQGVNWGRHGCISLETWLDAGTYDFVEVQTRLVRPAGAVVYRCGPVTLIVTIFKRVS